MKKNKILINDQLNYNSDDFIELEYEDYCLSINDNRFLFGEEIPNEIFQETNIINFEFTNLTININPPFTIESYSFSIEFKIIKFPIYIDLNFISSESHEGLNISIENIK